jgi:tRNA(fMet)-specific endonuclease VapC
VADPAFLLDSNICIYVLRDGAGRAALRLGDSNRGSVVTSMIVYAEVMRGFASVEPALTIGATRLFDLVEPLPFDRRAAELYTMLPFKRASFDRLIAAHALSMGLTLVTNNERDFADIPDLKVENWTI